MCETWKPSGCELSAPRVKAKYGTRSVVCNCSNDFCTEEISFSGDLSAAPNPGKWPANTANLSSLPECKPSMKALPISPTQYGLPPKLLVPAMAATWLWSVSITSKLGPIKRLIPIARSSLPSTSPACLARSVDQVAPRASGAGCNENPSSMVPPAFSRLACSSPI